MVVHSLFIYISNLHPIMQSLYILVIHSLYTLVMAFLIYNTCMLMVLLSSSVTSFAYPGFSFGWGGGGGGGDGSFGGGDGSFGGVQGYSGLFPEFYSFSCPQANDIVMSVLEDVIAKDPRMAASLLRLHFHDCFVQVSILHVP